MTEASQRHRYTTGGDERLLHRRWIGSGSNGHVHEIYDIPTGKAFARKLLHIPGPDQPEIDNEVRAIMKLCKKRHRNIVSVLKYGELPNSAYYFIDMELCDLNLATYIHRTDPPNPSESLPCFIKDASVELRVVQIWNIMRQVAGGIKYIHGHDLVHRDVKPANVLYSRKDSVWKLADFGITSEGTARRARTTTGGRGTPGYRAPELMSDIANGVYNNKVDIWSMGCILYELAQGTKVFNSDWAVIQHQLAGKDLDINLSETFDDACGRELSRNINLMLRIDPQSRPPATTFSETFTRHCRLVESLLPDDDEVETLDAAYDGLSLQQNRAEAKDEERRRIDAIIKAWKDSGIDILSERDETGKTAIQKAAEEGDLDKLKALKKLGADFNSSLGDAGHTPIYFAARYGRVEAIRLLNEWGIDLSAKTNYGSAAIHAAANCGYVDAVKALVESGIDPSVRGEHGNTPTHSAADGGHGAVIFTLRKLGADVSVKNDRRLRPMHIAARTGSLFAMEVLKELGADVSGRGDDQGAPLHMAAACGRVEAIRRLKELGADVLATDPHMGTAVHTAAMYGQAHSIGTLQEIGANISMSRAGDGRTPLHIAACYGRMDCIRLLHELGADLGAKDAYGHTPYEVANSFGHRLAAIVLSALAAGGGITYIPYQLQ